MASFVSIALVMLLIVSTSAHGYGQAQLHINGAITCQGSTGKKWVMVRHVKRERRRFFQRRGEISQRGRKKN